MHKKRQRQSKCKKLVTVLQIAQIPSDMAAATQGISVLIDQLFLACAMLCKFTTCFLCLTKNSSCVLAPSCTISSSAAPLFDGGEASRYLDCCSICITTIIICMYLIRTVISFIWVTGFFFFLPSLSCDFTCSTRKATPTQHGGKNMCFWVSDIVTKEEHTLWNYSSSRTTALKIHLNFTCPPIICNHLCWADQQFITRLTWR